MRFPARRLACAIAALALWMMASVVQAQSDEADRVRAAATVLDEIMAAADSAIPASVLGKAVAIAVFPGTLRGGFIVGAERGRGILSVKDGKATALETVAVWRDALAKYAR